LQVLKPACDHFIPEMCLLVLARRHADFCHTKCDAREMQSFFFGLMLSSMVYNLEAKSTVMTFHSEVTDACISSGIPEDDLGALGIVV
jgi:hypothetical protein